MAPLLKKSGSGGGTPKFVTMSSRLGSASAQDHPMMKGVRIAAYGVSKAGMNYWVKRCHVEEEWLVAFAMSPGWVLWRRTAEDFWKADVK